MLVAACSGAAPPAGAEAGVSPTTFDTRTQGAALAAACEGRDGWADAAPPARIHGNTYYIGTCGIAVLLITSDSGHVLIDGAVAEAVPAILANIRSLGFDPRDIRGLFFTHEHYDHMGGLAALAEATGAPVWSSEAARASLISGEVDATDPQFGLIDGSAPVSVSGTFTNGQPITVGATTIRPLLTPGHTSGGTSWNWESCEQGECVTFAYVDSLSAVSRDGYRFTDHPERVAPFRTTLAAVAQMPCEVLVTPHPGFSNLFERLAGQAPLVDQAACRDLSAMMTTRLDTRLAQEAANQ